MKLIKTSDGSTIEATIVKANNFDFIRIGNENQYTFDWSLERKNEVYKINSLENDEILGLICLIDFPKEERIHIHLIELSKGNYGKDKAVKNIAGCLIAFACQQSFLRGYYGFISLIPKTDLIKHYIEKYGFSINGKILTIEGEASKLLILKYL